MIATLRSICFMEWRGGQVGTAAEAVLAPNPGPMTLDGTNTWIVQAPRGGSAVVVDPGPLDEGHLAAVAERVRRRGAAVGLIVLTHHHLDHAEGAARFAELTGAPVLRPGQDGAAGAPAAVPDLGLEVLATPGHTADSVCLLAPDAGLLLTGDTVLGRGSTVIAAPDGRLGAYLSSLRLLLDVVRRREVRHLLPGHGPARDEPAAVIRQYLDHREVRLRQVRAAVEAGAVTARDVVRRVYADVPRELWPAAEASVRAQLDYLAGE